MSQSTTGKPPLIDRLVGYFSPRAGLERAAYRQMQASYRGGVSTRLSESWGSAQGLRFGTSGERQAQMGMRDRAYQAFRDNPVARTLVQTETDNVIGDGLNYQPTSSSPEWNREAKDRYYEWLEGCSVRGPDIHSGCELQRMIWERSRVAGDIGWLLVARDFIDPQTGAVVVDSRVQMVPAENISTPDGMWADRSIYDGIRFDPMGRPTAFFVLSHDERGATRAWKEVPARDFVFLPHMSEPTQARGLSCYQTIFDMLSQLERYIDGVSLAAWMATVFGIIFKEKNAAKQVQALDYLTNSQGNQQRAITFENGQMKFIAPEGDVVQVDAKQPMQQTPEFIRSMYRIIGQPFDMPLEVLAKDMSTVNFSSARVGLLGFYRSCRIKAAKFAARWSRTIRWWLSRERLRGPNDPKRWKNAFPADYWTHELLVNAWEYTDPLSEAQSDHLQIDMGTKSVQMVIAERGRDEEQITRERREWQEKAEDLPQVRSTMTRDAKQAVTAVDADGNPINDSQPLNGIQITAALDVLAKVAENTIPEEAAIEMLSRLGIAPDRAKAITTSAKQNKTGISTSDRTYQREMLLKLMDVPQAREAVYNGTDIEDLIAQTGLPPEKGYEAPYAVVVAPTGPLVSGAVIRDPEGDIVGGDVENVAEPDGQMEGGGTRNGSPSAPGVGGDGEEGEEGEEEAPEAEPEKSEEADEA